MKTFQKAKYTGESHITINKSKIGHLHSKVGVWWPLGVLVAFGAVVSSTRLQLGC